MPPSRRSNRGGAFGGSLLAVPTPLPDDEVIPLAAESAEHAPDVGPRDPESLAIALPQRSPALEAQVEDDAQFESAVRGSAAGRRPPSTIRLDERAGHPLFDAFVEAKRQDPFLSYRQFASGVVLDGLTLHRRRQNRS